MYNFCGLQACVPLVVLLQCGFVFHALVHNNKCVEETVLALTYTNNSAAKNSRFGGGRGQGFRISPSVVRIAFTFSFVLV